MLTKRLMLTLRIRFYYVLSACISLCIGYLIYFLGRPGPVIYAIPESLQQWVFTLPLLSHISGSLPGFFHTFAFILFIAVVLNPSRVGLVLVCSGWILVELFFEIGQHPFFANHLAEAVPVWFSNIPFLEVADSYFLTGTFDPVDVLFIFFGTAAAFLVLNKVQLREVNHV